MTKSSLRSIALLAFLLASATASAQRPPLIVPTDPNRVLEVLPAGYPGLDSPVLPGDPPLLRIQQMLNIAARTGDTRLSTRAQAMLDRIEPAKVDANVLSAKAFSAQHRHDFDQSRALLTEVLRRDPADGDALMSRAQVSIVQGHLNDARRDCAVLALRVDAGLGTICTAALQLRLGDYHAASRLADRWLAGADADAGLKRFVLMMRGDIASRGRSKDATQWYTQALALDPQDVRSRLAFARHLRRTGKPLAALDVLASAADSDTVLLQRILAAREAGLPEAGKWASQLARRFQLARQTGSGTELRDEAEFHLAVRGDAELGLKLALENFRTQRDLEDQELLERAALQAHRPQALQTLHDWERSERVPALPVAASRP